MTLQAKAFQWSLGIHGIVLIVLTVMQVLVIPESKVTVIDFTLSENKVSPTEDSSSPFQPPAAEQEPQRTKSLRPKEIVKRQSTSNPDVEKAQPPPQVSNNGEVLPSSMSEAAIGSIATSAKGAHQDGTGAAGSALSAAGNYSKAEIAAAPEESRAAYLKEHFANIREKITENITYPHMARKMGWRGKVKIAFVVCEDGGVNDVRVIDSSGFGLLDRNALDTVKNVAPFPRPPIRAEIRVVITYQLH
jgi:periplasmic protein TonB